jgi:hypothetical protein
MASLPATVVLRPVHGRVVEEGVGEQILRGVEHEGEFRVGLPAWPRLGQGGVVNGRVRRLVDPPGPTRAAEHHAADHLTVRITPLLAPAVRALVPEVDPQLGILVSSVEVLPRWSPPLTPVLALDPEAVPVRESPVNEASVGFFCHVRVDRVRYRRKNRPVAPLGSKE